MKKQKQASNYKIIAGSYEKFTTYQRHKIVEALRYIKSRGVKLKWTRENSSYLKYEAENDLSPEMPCILGLTTLGTVNYIIKYINLCLDYIQKFNDSQDKKLDNEKILEIKRILEEKQSTPGDAPKPGCQVKRDTIKNENDSSCKDNQDIDKTKPGKINFECNKKISEDLRQEFIEAFKEFYTFGFILHNTRPSNDKQG